MADDNLQDEATDDVPRMPSHAPLPPPPDVSYTRPSLGHAAPARTEAERRDAGGPVTPMDNAAKVGAGLSAGILLCASILVGFGIGQYLDRHFIHSATPWGTLAMTLVGVAAGFLNLFRLLNATDGKRK